MKRSDELRQKMDTEITAADTLVKSAESEGRNLTAAENAKFKAHIAKSESLQSEYTDAKEQEENTRVMRAMQASNNSPTPVYGLNGGGYESNTGFNWGAGPHVVLPKLSAFNGGGNRQQAARDAYDCGLALKAVLFRDSDAREKVISRRGEGWFATMNESNPVDGGYLVAPEFSTAVFTAWEQTGAIQKLARRVPMKSDSLTFEKQTSGTTVYYPGEEGEITASDLDIARVTLYPKKRAILSYISNELNDDAIVPVTDMLATDMGHQFALKQDQEGVIGDGTSTYGGVYGIKTAMAGATAGISTCAAGNDTWAEITLADIGACMSLVPDKYRVQGQLAWLCSQAFKWQVFDRLALTSGGALATEMVNGIPQMFFNGVPVVTSDRCTTATAAATIHAYFGNWNQALLLGERTQVRIATSEHIAFTTDRLAIRGTVRYDINFHQPSTASAAGAVVALKTAS